MSLAILRIMVFTAIFFVPLCLGFLLGARWNGLRLNRHYRLLFKEITKTTGPSMLEVERLSEILWERGHPGDRGRGGDG